MSFERIRRITQPVVRTVPHKDPGNLPEIKKFSTLTESPKISVIIPYAGNDSLRDRNLRHCLNSIAAQTYLDYEVILVEQNIDGNFYKKWIEEQGIKWIGIKDPMNRGFNLSWCRNVGAKHSRGEKIVLMDSDMCFESEYLDQVAKTPQFFCGGAKLYHWIREEKVTRIFENGRDFQGVYSYGNGNHRDPVFRFRTFVSGNGFGAVLVFDRNWFINVFRGYPEEFFQYGWEDKAGVEIIKKLLEIENNENIPTIDYEIVHLSHGNKNFSNMKTNEDLYDRIKNMTKQQWIDIVSSADFGSLESPRILINL